MAAEVASSNLPPENRLTFNPQPPEIGDAERRLLEQYSGIPSDRIVTHVVDVRDRAWKIFPYPCIGMYRFLDMDIITSPVYGEVVQRVKNGEKLLDLGCCFGQELRQLAFNGVPTENLYGSDLRMDFMELGYDLFLDRDKLEAKFIAADIFDEDSDLKLLDGQINIIHTGSFFHLFTWNEQVQIAKRVIRLLKPQPNSMVIGRQIGNLAPGEYLRRNGKGTRYRHNEDTWKRMWEEVGNATGTKWKVEAGLVDNDIRMVEDFRFLQPKGTRRLRFIVRRE